MPDSSAELTFQGPAEPGCLDRIHELMQQLWQAGPPVDDVDQMMFAMAVLEIANNIVRHRDGEHRDISLVLRTNWQELSADILDNGAAVDVDVAGATLPEDDLAESGRGLVLARMALSEFSYQRVSERNHWHLVRRRGE